MYTAQSSETLFSLTHFPLRRKFIFIYLDFLLFLAHSQECHLHVQASGVSQGNWWPHHPLQIWDNPVPCSQGIKATHSGPKEKEHPAVLR